MHYFIIQVTHSQVFSTLDICGMECLNMQKETPITLVHSASTTTTIREMDMVCIYPLVFVLMFIKYSSYINISQFKTIKKFVEAIYKGEWFNDTYLWKGVFINIEQHYSYNGDFDKGKRNGLGRNNESEGLKIYYLFDCFFSICNKKNSFLKIPDIIRTIMEDGKMMRNGEEEKETLSLIIIPFIVDGLIKD
jgi:hypothetical protein